MNRKKIRHSPARTVLVALLALGTAGCLPEEDDYDSSFSGAADNLPSSIVGFEIRFTVQSASGSAVGPGFEVIYDYASGGQVSGYNTRSGTQYSPDRYTYQRNSSSADITLYYQQGTEYYTLSPSSECAGSYAYEAVFTDGRNGGEANGLYRIYNSQCGQNPNGDSDTSGNGGDSGAGSQQQEPCERDGTGTLMFWLSEPNARGSVTVSVNGLGSRSTSSYFPGAGPSCPQSQGTMLYSDVPSGSYSFSANDESGLNWSGNARVNTCGCTSFELQ